MRKFNVQNGLILVEKYDKVRRQKGENPFVLESSDNLGIVRFLDEAGVAGMQLVPGTKVYFGSKYTDRVIIGGSEMYAMKEDNIIAVLVEEPVDDEQQKQ